MSEKIKFKRGETNPALMKSLEDFVGMLRLGLAPVFSAASNADEDGAVIADAQNMALHAAVVFAGMTAGHMTFFGLLDKDAGDLEDFKKEAIASLFDFGVEQGLAEAQRAAVAQRMGSTVQ